MDDNEDDTNDMVELNDAFDSANLQEMSLQVLKSLQSPILKKLDSASISNVADVLFAYSLTGSDLLLTEEFVGKLRKSVHDKLIIKDYFNSFNATKAQWALAKHQTKDLTPAFNMDVANPILSRADIAKVEQISH